MYETTNAECAFYVYIDVCISRVSTFDEIVATHLANISIRVMRFVWRCAQPEIVCTSFFDLLDEVVLFIFLL